MSKKRKTGPLGGRERDLLRWGIQFLYHYYLPSPAPSSPSKNSLMSVRFSKAWIDYCLTRKKGIPSRSPYHTFKITSLPCWKPQNLRCPFSFFFFWSSWLLESTHPPFQRLLPWYEVPTYKIDLVFGDFLWQHSPREITNVVPNLGCYDQ